MTINYPNGKSFLHHDGHAQKKQAPKKKSPIEFGNRGMTFEEYINQSNDYYLSRGLAVIHKKPTPIQVVKVDYPRRSAAVIREAYFNQASTTDYNGVYKGHYLDFEAKETKNKTSFPLRNFHAHQLEHMKKCREQYGVVFVLLWFSNLERCFLLGADDLFLFWKQQETGKKSMPLKEIEACGIEITLGIAPRVPYIEAVNEYIQKEIHHESN